MGGGILCNVYSSPTLENIIFAGNWAGGGGGLYCKYSSPTVINCTFWDNSVEFRGGALACTGSSPTLINCTLSGNSSNLYGSGVFCNSGSSPTFDNCIVAFGELTEAVYCEPDCEPVFTCCNIYGNEGGDWIGYIADQYGINGNISTDPLFCNAQSGDLHLQSDSPCSDNNPECGLIGAWPVGCEPAAVEGGSGPSIATHLAPGRPNPFRASTSIGYVIPRDQDGVPVLLRVFDPTGRVVRTLVDAPQTSGSHTVSWDGTNREGVPLAGGVYFYQLALNGETQTRRLILVR